MDNYDIEVPAERKPRGRPDRDWAKHMPRSNPTRSNGMATWDGWLKTYSHPCIKPGPQSWKRNRKTQYRALAA